MQDVFGNVDVIISNAKQDKIGLVPEEGKTGRVIFKPKENQWRLATYADGHVLKHGPDSVFQVTTLDKYPVRFGVGVIEDNKLNPFVWVVRDEDDSMYALTNFYEDILRTKLPFNSDLVEKLNTIAFIYTNGAYVISYSYGANLPIDSHGVFSNVTPVYFVDFDTPLKAAFIGNPFKPDKDDRIKITERPNYFIKDYNA